MLNNLLMLLILIAPTVIFPLLCLLAAWMYQLILQRLPERQRQTIDQAVQHAVQAVEQQYAGASNTEKKRVALGLARMFFVTFKVPVPPEPVLSAAIESAVLALKLMQPPEYLVPAPTPEQKT